MRGRHKLRVLDLCCGAGGVGEGYHRAGFEVVGVDIEPQPHYPFEFHRADALTFPLDGFDLAHASPPCHAWTELTHRHPDLIESAPRLIEPLRLRFIEAGVPYVIENVEGAPLLLPVTLCGSMFGLACERGWLRRHRLFEASFPISALRCNHPEGVRAIDVSGTGGSGGRCLKPYTYELPDLMGIDWMTRREVAQAIPPAYTHYIGEQFRARVHQP